jgi:hypothetical protein
MDIPDLKFGPFDGLEAQARSRIESILSELYDPEEVQIWMTSPHLWLDNRWAVDLIAEGRADEVLAAVNRLIDGAW